MSIQQGNIKIHHKTQKFTEGKYHFSTVYLTIGNHIIGETDAVSLTELMVSEIEGLIAEARTQKNAWKNENAINKAVFAFPKNNECFDGENGFLAFLDETNAVLTWEDFETGNILATIVNFDHYIEQWETVLNGLRTCL